LRGEQRQRAPFVLNVNSAGQAKNTIKRMSDMKKIKTKLVTFVTDNVRLVGIVGDKDLLARMSQEKER
jgi:Tfp pilus assembly protein PilP